MKKTREETEAREYGGSSAFDINYIKISTDTNRNVGIIRLLESRIAISREHMQ